MTRDDDRRLPASPRQVSQFLSSAFAHQRGIGGWVTRLRPYICPFEEILRRIPTGASVLDAGCGVGIMSALAAGPGKASKVVGFDVAQRPIAISRRVTIANASPMTFHVLPPGQFPRGEFEVVLCIDVLHHVPTAEQWAFLQEATTHVRPGGTLILKDISPRPRWKALANRLHDLIMARQWVHHRHERDVAAHLESLGGEVAEESRLDRLWYSHYLIRWRKAGSAA